MYTTIGYENQALNAIDTSLHAYVVGFMPSYKHTDKISYTLYQELNLAFAIPHVYTM